MRVLLVDDDDLVARALSRMLRRDHEVVVASNRAEAVRLWSEQALDAIICDYDLGPGETDGVALIRELGLPGLLLTGHANIEASVPALLKPATREDLLAALHRATTGNSRTP